MADESDWTPLFKSPPWRFSLRQLLIGIALIAVALLALRSASPVWVMVLLSLTLLVLAASPLVALYRQGPQRAYWIGFATMGWFYMLVLLYCWSLDAQTFKWNTPLRADQLLTTRLSSVLHDWMYPNADSSAGMGMGGFTSAKGMSSKSGNMMTSGPPPGRGSMSGSPGSVAPATAPGVIDFFTVAPSL